MADAILLDNDRTTIAASAADVAYRLNYWSTSLRECGLHAESVAIAEAVNEITMLRLELAQYTGRVDLRPARRDITGVLTRD